MVKNWGFFSSFTKISWFSTFTWVIPKKYRKKTVQFSFGHRIAIYASIFKKLVSFDIGKVWPIWIRHQNLYDFRRFLAILGDFREIAENRVHFSLQMLLSDLVKIVGPYEFWQILTLLTFLISKMSDFLKIDAYMAILGDFRRVLQKKNTTDFSFFCENRP